MVNNNPTQLAQKSQDLQEKFFARNPQLAEKLIPLMNRANVVQNSIAQNVIPYSQSPRQLALRTSQDLMDATFLTEPMSTNSMGTNTNINSSTTKQLIKKLNTHANDSLIAKPQNTTNSNIKKITDIDPRILYGMR